MPMASYRSEDTFLSIAPKEKAAEKLRLNHLFTHHHDSGK
jgi:hypothetical protein